MTAGAAVAREDRYVDAIVGDRDPFCTVEEGATAYRAVPDGELAVLPNTGHLISPAAVQATLEFFERRLDVGA
jgi:fermentation-respiration switch protein FrsA (DUF1100 family)